MKLLLFILITFTACLSFSYVPKFSTISSKIIRSRSSKPIKVVQDIVVKDQLSGLSYTVRETLYIKNGQQLKIKVEGKDILAGQVNAGFIYNGPQKTSIVGNTVKNSTTPNLFYAPLIYTHSNGNFKKLLLTKEIIPSNTDPMPPVMVGKASYSKNSFTHLSRTNGEVSYAITKKLSSSNNLNPTLWVSNKNFQVNKIRLDENGTISLRNYKKYSKKLNHAGEQIIKWKSYTYYINTVSVSYLSSASANKELSQSSLLQGNSIKNFKSDALETFYSVFR